MLDRIRKGQRWLTILFIAVIGGVFVFFMGLGGPPSVGGGAAAGTVIKLDDIQISTQDFQRVRYNQEQRFREQLGKDFDAKTAAAFLDQQSIRSLVEMVVLAHAAEEIGLRVSKQEVQDFLKRTNAFRDEEGRFDRKAFRDWAEYNYGNQKLFLDSITLDLMQQKMVQLLSSQPRVSDGEARRALYHRLEEAQFLYVALDTQSLPAESALTDEEVSAYLAANEVQVRELYTARESSFQTPEQAEARHILIRLVEGADEASEAAAKEKLAAARERITAGESFADVASEVSEDAGTKANGGSLGSFARGELDAALADTAFALEPGSISPPVRTSQGLHLIQTVKKVPAGARSFDDVSAELAREAATAAAADKRANALVDELKAAIAAGDSLEAAARSRDLAVERPGPLRRRPDGYIQGLGGALELQAEIFSLEPGKSSDKVFNIDSKLVLVQAIDHTTPSESDLEAELDITRKQLELAKRNRFVRTWVDTRQQKLSNEGRLFIDANLATGA